MKNLDCLAGSLGLGVLARFGRLRSADADPAGAGQASRGPASHAAKPTPPPADAASCARRPPPSRTGKPVRHSAWLVRYAAGDQRPGHLRAGDQEALPNVQINRITFRSPSTSQINSMAARENPTSGASRQPLRLGPAACAGPDWLYHRRQLGRRQLLPAGPDGHLQGPGKYSAGDLPAGHGLNDMLTSRPRRRRSNGTIQWTWDRMIEYATKMTKNPSADAEHGVAVNLWRQTSRRLWRRLHAGTTPTITPKMDFNPAVIDSHRATGPAWQDKVSGSGRPSKAMSVDLGPKQAWYGPGRGGWLFWQTPTSRTLRSRRYPQAKTNKHINFNDF